MSDKEKIQSGFRVVNLSSYEMPTVKEVYNKDYICFGEDNAYFDRLVELSMVSATNARCVNGISDMIYGRGLESLNSDKFPKDYVRFKKLLKPNDIKNITKDYYTLAQAAVQISYNRSKTEILKVSHFPMVTLRASKAIKGVIKSWHYHPDWENKKPNDKTKIIPSFGCGSKGQLNELYIIKPYSPKFYYYAPAFYNGCLHL